MPCQHAAIDINQQQQQQQQSYEFGNGVINARAVPVELFSFYSSMTSDLRAPTKKARLTMTRTGKILTTTKAWNKS